MTDSFSYFKATILVPHLDGLQHGVSIQSSINFGQKTFRITREGIATQILILARMFIYISIIYHPNVLNSFIKRLGFYF